MCKLDEKAIITSISEVKAKVDRIKGLNEGLMESLGLENVLKRLNKEYLEDKCDIVESKRQIYVKTFTKEFPLIVDFIGLYEFSKCFLISTLNGTHVYVTAFANLRLNKNTAVDFLEADLNSKKLTERENVVYFERNEMIGSYAEGIKEVDLEEINTRIARVFFETYLKLEALSKTGGGPSEGD